MKNIFSLACTIAALLGLTAAAVVPDAAWAAHAAKKKTEQPASSVYEKQPPVTEKELLGFLELLPQFRAWAKANNEEAHPVLRNGKADFLYSPNAAAWVQAHAFSARQAARVWPGGRRDQFPGRVRPAATSCR